MTETKAIDVIEYTKTFDEFKGTAQNVAFDMAIKALGKQISKKISRESLEESYRCPSCNSERSWKDGTYCKDCGQKLGW